MRKRIEPFLRGLLLLMGMGLLAPEPPVMAREREIRPATEVPLRVLRGKLLVDVGVRGQTRRFLFDTGASYTCITEELCTWLLPDTLGSLKVNDSGGQSRSLPVVRLDTLQLGEWTILGSRALVTSGDNPVFACYGIDGIIGSDILQGQVVRLSLRDSTLTLAADASQWHLDPKNSVKIKIFGTRPFFRMPVSNGSRRAFNWVLVDTGAERYSCTEHHFDHLYQKGVIDSLQEGFGRLSYGLYGEEPEARQRMAIAPQIRIGNSVLENVPVTSTQGGSSLLGTFVLKYGDLVIDYRRKRLYYDPFGEDLRVKDPLPHRLSVMYIGGAFVVGVVWEGSLSSRIASGDRVLSFDDRPAEEVSHCDLLTGVQSFAPGTILRIENRLGEIIEVEL